MIRRLLVAFADAPILTGYGLLGVTVGVICLALAPFPLWLSLTDLLGGVAILVLVLL